MILIVLFTVLNTNKTMSNTSNKDYENSVKIGDYVEYKLIVHYKIGIDFSGNPVSHISTYSGVTGFLRWTVTGLNGKNKTLKIEISIPNVYSDVKEITIFNGIMYNTSTYKPLGYNPFWISLNSSQKENVTLAGTINNPLIGKNVNSNTQLGYLGGYYDVLEFANTNSYYVPGLASPDIGLFKLFYSKFNGIMIGLGNSDSPFFWVSLHFSYKFATEFILSKSNIDFGAINAGYTLLTYIAPLWLPIFIISGVIIIILIIKVKNWKRNRHG